MLKSVHHVPEHLSTMSPDRTRGEGRGEGEMNYFIRAI